MSDCLDLDRVRALAEVGDALDPPAAAHARACARCARRVAQARAEEQALRAALPVEPPPGVVDATLRAVRAAADDAGDDAAEPRSRRPRARRRPAAGASAAPLWLPLVLALLVVAAGALALRARPAPSTSPPPGPPAPAAPPPAATPPPPTVAPPPAALDLDPWDASQDDGEDDPAPSPEPPAAPPPDVVVEAPPQTDAPPPPTAAPAALARVASGKVDAGGRVLGPGDALAAGEALRAVGGPAEVEVPGCVAVALAPRAIARLERAGDEVAVRLERGRLLVRTRGPGAWALVTAEGQARPLGTALLAQRDGARTRLATVEGLVRVSPATGGDALDLRPGFEAELARGRPLAARPASPLGPALTWLPAALRPAAPASPELLAEHLFEDGRGRWTRGDPHTPGARGSRACLRGVAGAGDYAVSVELEALAGVVTVEPDLWLEATVRVDRPARVALQVWDFDRKENLAHLATVEAGRWTTLAAPLRAFTGPAGEPRGPVVRGGRGTCVTVFAGEPGQPLELLVDDVRLWRQP